MRYTPVHRSFYDDGPGNTKVCIEVPSDGPGVRGLYYRLSYIQAVLNSSRSSGIRLLKLLVEDENGHEMCSVFSSYGQGLNKQVYYLFTQNGVYDDVTVPGSTIDRAVRLSIPNDLHLQAGWKVKVLDVNNRDEAEDQLTVSGSYEIIQL